MEERHKRGLTRLLGDRYSAAGVKAVALGKIDGPSDPTLQSMGCDHRAYGTSLVSQARSRSLKTRNWKSPSAC